MRNERGSAAILGVIAGLVVTIVLFYFLGYLGFRNAAQAYEIDVPAQYTEMQNVYDNGWKKVVEIAQVPALQAQQTKEVYAAVMTGRYGANGSKAFVQLIHEQNPNLPAETYVTIQRTIESFHDSFQASQTNLIARKQEYGKFITATTGSIFYNWIGNYPHIHIGVPSGAADDFQIVTSDKTQTDFKNHKAGALDLSKGANQ